MKKTQSIKKDDNQHVEELKNQLDQAHQKYLRALADYQNLEKRLGHSVDQARQSARVEMLTRFIDVLDDLEKAEIFVQDDGLKMIMDRFRNIFDQAGIEEIDVLGKEYDPYTSEAIEMTAGDESQRNHVVEVVRKGYKLGDTIIRTAQVKVSN